MPPHNSCQLKASLCVAQHDVLSVAKVVSKRLRCYRYYGVKIGHCAVWIRHMSSGFSDHFSPDSSADGSSYLSSSSSSSTHCSAAAIVVAVSESLNIPCIVLLFIFLIWFLDPAGIFLKWSPHPDGLKHPVSVNICNTHSICKHRCQEYLHAIFDQMIGSNIGLKCDLPFDMMLVFPQMLNLT